MNIIGLILLVLLFVVGMYYFYPRYVAFSLKNTINLPIKEIENVDIPYNYISEEDILKQVILKKTECDSLFIHNLSATFDFLQYDYIITYGKELLKLSYSPYLKKFKDGCSSVDGMPLIPTCESAITNKVYIYQIKKSSKYRGTCG